MNKKANGNCGKYCFVCNLGKQVKGMMNGDLYFGLRTKIKKHMKKSVGLYIAIAIQNMDYNALDALNDVINLWNTRYKEDNK